MFKIALFTFNGMCLVGLGKGLKQRRRFGKIFLFGVNGCCTDDSALNGSIQVKIERRRNAELRQRMFYRRLHKSIHNLFIFKLYFLLGGMHIYIYLRRDQGQ